MDSQREAWSLWRSRQNKGLAYQCGGYEARTHVDDRVREFKWSLGTL